MGGSAEDAILRDPRRGQTRQRTPDGSSLIGIETTTEGFGDGTVVLAVAGELDLDTTPRFEAELLTVMQTGAPRMIVDLSLCEFLDSTALRALVRTSEHYPPASRLALVISNANVLRVFEITHLEQAFAIHPTLHQARKGLEAHRPQ